MASPMLLIKPLLKVIAKELAKQGLKEVALSNIDAVNILRTMVDKKLTSTVAKSLGITSKELTKVTDAINLTEARKKAVTGKNFIKNVNRFIENPQTSIKQYVKNELKSRINKGLKNETEDLKENANEKIVRNALTLLEGKLKKINPTLSLPDKIWDNASNIDVDDIFACMEYLEVDFYYTANYDTDNPIYLDTEHRGYRQGMEEQDFLGMIEGMLLDGHHSTPVDGIY